MQKFQDTFETCRRSFISTFSIYMTVPLRNSGTGKETILRLKVNRTLLLGSAFIKTEIISYLVDFSSLGVFRISILTLLLMKLNVNMRRKPAK